MSELTSGVSEFDVRLAEIDRRLRTIQTELVPESEPRPGVSGRSGPLAALLLASQPKPAPSSPEDPAKDLSELTELHERLLASMRDLLSAYEDVLSRLSAANADATVQEFAVSAGPFESTEALREFEHALAGLPSVREVAVRGYEGTDRAIVDVRLSEPRS